MPKWKRRLKYYKKTYSNLPYNSSYPYYFIYPYSGNTYMIMSPIKLVWLDNGAGGGYGILRPPGGGSIMVDIYRYNGSTFDLILINSSTAYWFIQDLLSMQEINFDVVKESDPSYVRFHATTSAQWITAKIEYNNQLGWTPSPLYYYNKNDGRPISS